jgi:hypothetical protein
MDLLELAAKDEYAHTLKVSLELIRFKAQLQASQIIADELTAITQNSRKNISQSAPEVEYNSAQQNELENKSINNVVPFRRRASGGTVDF